MHSVVSAEPQTQQNTIISTATIQRTALDSPTVETEIDRRVREAQWLLALRDHLDRAQASVPQPDPDHASWQLPLFPWVEDLAQASRLIGEALAKLAVEATAHAGEPYDPTYHTLVDSDASTDLQSPRIQSVVKQGFRIGSDVVRKALVVVGTARGER
jgi:molecular chaperone GrpE (heat shock protein)